MSAHEFWKFYGNVHQKIFLICFLLLMMHGWAPIFYFTIYLIGHMRIDFFWIALVLTTLQVASFAFIRFAIANPNEVSDRPVPIDQFLIKLLSGFAIVAHVAILCWLYLAATSEVSAISELLESPQRLGQRLGFGVLLVYGLVWAYAAYQFIDLSDVDFRSRCRFAVKPL